MIVPKIEIENLTSKNESILLRHLYFDAKARTLVAADGFELVEIPVESSPKDKTGFVPIIALKIARLTKSREIILNPKKIRFIGTSIVLDRPQKAYSDEGMSELNKIRALATNRRSIVTICFDAELLYKVAQTIYDNGKEQKPVTLYYRGKENPLTIYTTPQTRFVLMPMGIEKSD